MPRLMLAQSDRSVRKTWAPAGWLPPLFSVVAFRHAKELRMKGESTLFPGAPLSPALCDNPVFMPGGPDGHSDASAHVPCCRSQITIRSLCCTRYSVTTSVLDRAHLLFFLLSFFFFLPQAILCAICPLWLGC